MDHVPTLRAVFMAIAAGVVLILSAVGKDLWEWWRGR